MDLTQFLQQLDELTASAVSTFEAAPDQETLEQARIDFLGAKKGQLKAAQKLFGAVGKEDRPTAGQRFNETKQAIEAALEQAQHSQLRNFPEKAPGPTVITEYTLWILSIRRLSTRCAKRCSQSASP